MKAVLLGVALVFGPEAAAHGQPPAYPSSEVAAERLRQCGFPEVELNFESELQEDVLNLPEATVATAGELSCAARVAVETGYYLAWPESLRERYWAAYGVISKEASQDSARKWLSERGMLERVSHFDSATMDPSRFAGQLEAACGPQASGAIGSQYGWHTFNDAWLAEWAARVQNGHAAEPTSDGGALECLLYAAAYAGFDLGFVGNEKTVATDAPLAR